MKTEQDVAAYLDNLNDLCCICLHENVKNVFSNTLSNNWEALSSIVRTCMHVEFLNCEILPSKICNICCDELEVANNFIKKCENANKVLRNIYNEYLANKEENDIKLYEIKHEGDQSVLSNVEHVEINVNSDNVQMYDSDEEPLSNNILSSKSDFEDDKSQLKEVIAKIHVRDNAPSEYMLGKKKRHKSDLGYKKNGKKSESFDKNSIIEKGEIKVEVIDELCKKEVTREEDESGDIENGKKIFICDLCRKPLKDKRSLIRHMKTQHSPEKMSELIFKVTGYGAERRFHCPDCPHTTRRKIDMKIHSRVHSGYRPHVCDICFRSFTQHASLAGHKKTHSDTKYYTCQECGKQFKYRETMKSHMRVHSNQFNYVCQLCNKGLKTEKSLTFHMKRHYNIKNHNCEVCGATFVTRAELTKHKYSHENKKRFYCTQCDYSSHWRQSLEIHTRRHLKDKSVQCDQCDYSCYTQVELKLHKRKHSKERHYQCPMCDEQFKQSTSVNKHMKNKHGQKFLWGKVADRRVIK